MQVWARDPNRVRKGLLTPLSAACVLRESGVGTWTMTVDETSQWSPLVDEGWGVIVYDGDRPIFSGPVTSIDASQEGDTRDVVLSGVTDMHVLRDRVVYPDPTVGYDQQTTVTHYAAKGPAEDLILGLITAQANPPTVGMEVRRAPGLVVPVSQGRGAVTSVEARWTVLLDEVRALAAVGGLVVDVVQDGTSLPVTVRTPVDRSRSVRFLPGVGLSDYKTSTDAPKATTVIVAGQGEGTARTVSGRSLANAARWGGRRIEQVMDRRDTADADELSKALDEALLEGGPASSATFTVAETPNSRFRRHYDLGDTVTVVLPGGGVVSDGVRFAEITWDEHGRTVELTVGPHSTDEPGTPPAIKNVRELQRALRGLVGRR